MDGNGKKIYGARWRHYLVESMGEILILVGICCSYTEDISLLIRQFVVYKAEESGRLIRVKDWLGVL